MNKLFVYYIIPEQVFSSASYDFNKIDSNVTKFFIDQQFSSKLVDLPIIYYESGSWPKLSEKKTTKHKIYQMEFYYNGSNYQNPHNQLKSIHHQLDLGLSSTAIRYVKIVYSKDYFFKRVVNFKSTYALYSDEHTNDCFNFILDTRSSIKFYSQFLDDLNNTLIRDKLFAICGKFNKRIYEMRLANIIEEHDPSIIYRGIFLINKVFEPNHIVYPKDTRQLYALISNLSYSKLERLYDIIMMFKKYPINKIISIKQNSLLYINDNLELNLKNHVKDIYILFIKSLY